MLSTRVVLSALAVSVFAAGCGKSGGAESGTSRSATQRGGAQSAADEQTNGSHESTRSLKAIHVATRAALIARADTICNRLGKEHAHLKLSTPQEARGVRTRLKIIEGNAVTELRATVPPGSLVSEWSRIVSGVSQLSSENLKVLEEIGAGNSRSTEVRRLLLTDNALRKRLIAAATRDGFLACARVI